MNRQKDLTIIGSETVGIAASVQASELGLRPLILDQKQWISKRILFSKRDAVWESVQGKSLLQRFQTLIAKGAIETLSQTTVWGVFPDTGLSLYHPDGISHLNTSCLLVTLPDEPQIPIFPGWTISGVWTAIDLEEAWERGELNSNSRVLLAGSQVDQLRIACQLMQAGVEVVALAYAPSLNPLHTLESQPELYPWQNTSLSLKQLAGKLRVKTRHMLCRVEGKHRVQRAVICEMDAAGYPIPNTESVLNVDAVVVDYGYATAPRLQALLSENSFLDSLVPSISMIQTPCINTDAAICKGQEIAICAAQALGAISQKKAENLLAPLQSQWTNYERLDTWHKLQTTTQPKFEALWDDRVVLCACEELTVEDLSPIIAQKPHFWSEINALKRFTRIGMGICQGRRCTYAANHLLRATQGKQKTQYFTVRPPLHPIPLGLIAKNAQQRYSETVENHTTPTEKRLPPS